MVLNDNEEYLPSETESMGEEPARTIEKPKDNEDSVSRNSLEDEVRVFVISNHTDEIAHVFYVGKVQDNTVSQKIHTIMKYTACHSPIF